MWWITGGRSPSSRDRRRSAAKLILLGEAMRQSGIICTSEVQVVWLEGGRVRTLNSIYALERQGDGEPPLPHLLHLCSMLHAWGFSRILGVAEGW
jgi:hypothetical protein